MKPKTKTLLFILLSFVLGVVAGILVDESGLLGRSRARRPSSKDFRTEFHRRLELDSVQIRSVDSLLDASRLRMNVHRTWMMQERDTLRSEMRQLLTSRQSAMYDEMNRESDARYNGRRDSLR
jgi:hypothetical protein